MQDSITIARQHDASLCPAWCEGGHLAEPAPSDDFHHDGPAWTLLPAQQPHADSDVYVSVVATQFVPDAGDAWAPVVEVTIGETDMSLSPTEVVSFARALLAAAEASLG